MSDANPEQSLRFAVWLCQTGQFEAAEQRCQEILSAIPEQTQALHLLALIAGRSGAYDQGIVLLRRAIAVSPQQLELHLLLAKFLDQQGKGLDAISSCQQALIIDSRSVAALYRLANLLYSGGIYDQAIDLFRRLLTIQPNHADALSNLGSTLKAVGSIDEAVACYRKARELKPGSIINDDNLFLALQYQAGVTPEELFVEAQNWNRQYAQHFESVHSKTPIRRPAGARLRIGYVSADLARHPVGLFLSPLLRCHDRNLFEIFCYSQIKTPDEYTRHLISLTEHWTDISSLTDDAVAELVQHDQVDILVNLAAHTAKNRLLVFARKPAPIQAVYLGYAGGTGVAQIDYRRTDRYLDPDVREDRYYLEKPLRLAGSYWCFEPADHPTETTDLPALSTGQVTYCCLNNYSKVTQQALQLWAAILEQVPGSRLLLHSPHGKHRLHIEQAFKQQGVGTERLEIIDRLSRDDYFDLYRRADIALDCFPFNGGATTCDALWMGVPVVSLSGDTPVGRAGVSILNNAGLADWIAHSPEQYIQLAVDRATHLPTLAQLRSSLRQQLRSSSLMDSQSYSLSIESAYQDMHRSYLQSHGITG
jgi:predicted O-linked N-acetylglucosamine transferase (SPINDLY family)